MLVPFLVRRAVSGAAVSRLYCAAILFVATLLCGLPLARAPVEGYVAHVQLTRHATRHDRPADSPPQLSATELQGHLTRGAAAHRLIALWNSRAARETVSSQQQEPDRASTPPLLEASDLADRLQVRVVKATNDQPRFLVQARGPSREQAERLARLGAEEIALVVDDRDGRAAARRAERLSRWETRELRHYETRALDALQAFLAEWKAKRQEEADTERQEKETPRFVAVQAGAELQRASSYIAPAERVENPPWRRLRDEIQQLETERQRLLARLQPRHPEVQALERQLEALRERLSYLPQFVPDTTALPRPNTTSPHGTADPGFAADAPGAVQPTSQELTAAEGEPPIDGDSISASEAAETSQKDYERWLALRKNYQDAVERREQRQRDNEAALYELLAATRQVNNWHVSPGRHASRIGGDVSRSAWMLVLLLAGTSGIGGYWLAGRHGPVRTFADARDVELATGLPVLEASESGSSTNRSSPHPRPSRLTRYVVLGGELIIVLFLIAFQAELCLHSSVSDLLGHPWEAPGNLLTRLFQGW